MFSFFKKSNNEEPTTKQEDNEDEDFEENEGRVEKAIEELRALVSGEKNLKVRMDNNFMLRYLRACGFNTKEAFSRLENVYKFKMKHKAYMCTRSPSEAKEIIEHNMVTLLEEQNHDGRRIIFFRIGDIDINKYNINDLSDATDLWIELILDNEESQKNGIHLLVDMGGFPWKLLRFFAPTPTIIFALREELRPWKNMDIHVVNTSRILNVIVNIVFPFLQADMKQRIHFHGNNWEELHKFIKPEQLLQEYGGLKSEYQFENMKELLFQNDEKIKELLSLGYVDDEVEQ